MQVVISKKISQKVSELAGLFGEEREQAIKQALLSYLKSVLKQTSLQKEFETWDKLSDEALINLEKDL